MPVECPQAHHHWPVIASASFNRSCRSPESDRQLRLILWLIAGQDTSCWAAVVVAFRPLTVTCGGHRAVAPEVFSQNHMDTTRWLVAERLLLLMSGGLLPPTTESVFTSDAHVAAVRRAVELAEELQVAELMKAVTFLRKLTAMDRRKQ